MKKKSAPASKKAKAKTATPKRAKHIYFFGGGKAEGNKEMKNLLGGKGANLAEMTNIGAPVPPGFTITTEVCIEFYATGRKLPKGLRTKCAPALPKWKPCWVPSLAIPRTRCWFPCARAHGPPCPG